MQVLFFDVGQASPAVHLQFFCGVERYVALTVIGDRRVGTAVAVAVFSFGIGALTALSKSKKHFIGLTWANGDVKGGFAMSDTGKKLWTPTP